MDAVISQATALAKGADEAGRKKIIDGLRDLSYALESPQDAMQRVMYTPLLVPAIKIGCDMGLFRILKESPEPLTVSQLAEKTGAEASLMGRLLRYLASVRVVKEMDKDVFAKTQLAETLALPGYEGGINFYWGTLTPCWQVMPEYLRQRNYRDIVSNTECPFNEAFKTKEPIFTWIRSSTFLFQQFSLFMEVQRFGMPTWLEVYPYQQAAKGLDPSRALFVDVGGSIGHQSVALREKLPDCPNRIIVQDRAEVEAQAIKKAGVEFMAYDFYTLQPIKGAKMYYLRNIIHDYPDERAVAILAQVRAALAPGSVVLIDDMVVPDRGVHWQAAQLDWTMLAACGSVERTEVQWRALLARAGLRITNVYTYTLSLCDSIIECVAE